MQIIMYDGTQEEYDRIVQEKTSQGLYLTNVSNITEGNFLGFLGNPITSPTPIEQRLEAIEDTLDIIVLKQEGIL